MTKLTTHCLDTFSGKPANDLKVDVYFISDKRKKWLSEYNPKVYKFCLDDQDIFCNISFKFLLVKN